jgi:endonuclease/exonuclease/phosphatase family metal-dependent hydrolase
VRVSVVSWNIWLGKHYSEVIDFLREQNADIIGLQELESGGDLDQAGRIGKHLGYECVFYPSFEAPVNTGKGDAVLSRYRILETARHFLSPSVNYDETPTMEPRIAVEAVIDLDGLKLTAFSTHLAYAAHFASSPAQAAQAETLANLVGGKEKTILMGDFNARPESHTVRTIASTLKHADVNLSVPTFTVYAHEYQDHRTADLTDRVDYIFASTDVEIVEAGVGVSEGSNHLPVWAVIDV